MVTPDDDVLHVSDDRCRSRSGGLLKIRHGGLTMCGIAGALLSAVSERPSELVRRMSDALAHRGPDDQGVWVGDFSHGENVALAHRRLSILDLSAAGRQPMASRSGRYVITFNGEIYNHESLRRSVSASCGGHGFDWRTSCDTETLLEAIEAWGVDDAVARSVGMFAFAVWDRRDRILTLARDRFGEKPLLYAWVGENFYFASELKAFRAAPGLAFDIDQEALGQYFRWGAVPAPLTIIKGVHKLRPAHLLSVKLPRARDEEQPRRYWSVRDYARAPTSVSPEKAVADLRARLAQAVQEQMAADVPLGAFLSGGIDSSTVVALMQERSTRRVQTFAIGFEEAGFNEAPYAARIAQELGTEHTELVVTPAEAREVIPDLPRIWDEPFADSSQIPTALLARLARKSVTVALTGDGGDELVMGYKRYDTSELLESVPCKSAFRRVLSWLPLDRMADAAGGAKASILSRQMRRLAASEQALGGVDAQERYLRLFLRPDRAGAVAQCAPGERLLPCENLGGIEARRIFSLVDAESYLPDDILVKVDRAAMAVGLETRAPFLDHRVAELAFSLPRSIACRSGIPKWPLREILKGYLRPELFERKKAGFAVPIANWLRGPLRGWAEDVLFSTQAAEGYVKKEALARLWREHLSSVRNNEDLLWRALMFAEWRRHVA